MTIRTTFIASSLIVASLVSGAAHATLLGRNMDGNAATFEAYYDTDLNITWLANANMNGLMTWAGATAWAANLSFYNPLTNQTYADWRLPTTIDTGAPGCDYANSGTDCGYNVDPASSEMAHLYFVTLGNQSYSTTTGAVSGAYAGGANPNSTLDNVGPFINFQSLNYWSGTEYAPNPSSAWYFNTYNGTQVSHDKTDSFYALAVSPGDVAAVPEPETYALMLAGLAAAWVIRSFG